MQSQANYFNTRACKLIAEEFQILRVGSWQQNLPSRRGGAGAPSQIIDDSFEDSRTHAHVRVLLAEGDRRFRFAQDSKMKIANCQAQKRSTSLARTVNNVRKSARTTTRMMKNAIINYIDVNLCLLTQLR